MAPTIVCFCLYPFNNNYYQLWKVPTTSCFFHFVYLCTCSISQSVHSSSIYVHLCSNTNQPSHTCSRHGGMHIYLCVHSQEADFDICATPPMNNLELSYTLVEEILVVSLPSASEQHFALTIV